MYEHVFFSYQLFVHLYIDMSFTYSYGQCVLNKQVSVVRETDTIRYGYVCVCLFAGVCARAGLRMGGCVIYIPEVNLCHIY